MSNKNIIQADQLGMNVTWFLKDLKLYDNPSGLLESLIFTAARLLIFFMAVIVHRAFYKMMQRLPDRPLNQMIYPYMVSTYLHRYISKKNRRSLKFLIWTISFFQIYVSSFMVPNLLYYTLVYWVYPMKHYIGEIGCNIAMLMLYSQTVAIQLHSFSMAIFRYICVFHGNILLKLKLSPNVCYFFLCL